jgi:hypothetical protein
VEVRVVQCEASFELRPERFSVHGSGPRPTCVEVAQPGCIIGRGKEADLGLVGPDCTSVSRSHLLLQPSGRQWTVTDLDSTKHTFEMGPEDRTWRKIPPDWPLPVEPEMKLRLGHRLMLRFDLMPSKGAAGTTTGTAEGGPSGCGRIRSLALEEVALALLARRRADPLDLRPPSEAELLRLVSFERAQLYRLLGGLKALPEIAAFAPADRSGLCEALAATFPYLLAPRSNDPAR